jgi:hypothetical protein
MLEVGAEKMKVSDEQNGEALCNIDPKQPFHGMGLAGMAQIGQGAAIAAVTGTLPLSRSDYCELV